MTCEILADRLADTLQPFVARQEVKGRALAVVRKRGFIDNGRRLSCEESRRKRLCRERDFIGLLFRSTVANLHESQMQVLGRIVILGGFVFEQPSLNGRDPPNDFAVRTADKVHPAPDIRAFSCEFFRQREIYENASGEQIALAPPLELSDCPTKRLPVG